ncbi:MAG TPA: hypothetical protein H9756_00560 [Candidatus Mediterraneibacter gallistercoris]|uniref:DUF6382 domain-containing protein n=1 Tax=Candidatus Mediterraneibacter gallistercoris TaxID=2838671 RepID=A0A9D2P3G0_9FIRM|nr:hypothetical protein [Candidatus Mediterraneibacter gallistercoris]
MNVTYENNWEYMDIHIDLEVPYKENYQIRMLNHNDIPGLMKIKGSGRDGHARYTYRINGGNSMEKEFNTKEMKKEDVRRFTKDLIETVDCLREYLLDPDGLLLSPELIFIRGGRYRFCYLPVSENGERQSLCASFHLMTEYFVKNLDYQDMAGILFVYKMHKETMKENYELKKIIEECRKEEKAWEKEQKKRIEKKSSFPENAVFSVNEEDDREEETRQEGRYQRKTDAEIIREKPVKYGLIKKAVNRIKTGRWGEWDDLITEMDGHEHKGHL